MVPIMVSSGGTKSPGDIVPGVKDCLEFLHEDVQLVLDYASATLNKQIVRQMMETSYSIILLILLSKCIVNI